jgi:hypothetical protein
MPAAPYNGGFKRENVIRFDGRNVDEITAAPAEQRKTAA